MAEESLFDDLLSPSEENSGQISDTDITSSTPGLEVPPGSASPDDVQITAGEIPTVRSMENILLETAGMEESIDLGNTSSVADDVQQPTETTKGEFGTEPKEEGVVQEKEEVAGESETVSEEKVSEEVTVQEDQVKPEEKADITKYFMDSTSNNASDDIFGTLASTSSPISEQLLDDKEQTTAAEEVVNDEGKSTNDRKVRIHLESHSSISEEATTVDFEEDKGHVSMKPTPSTRSLTKFFDSPETEGDAKDFFDTFTASKTDDALKLSCSPLPTASFPDLLESAAGTMAPPETPPVPSISPTPSPFHQLSAPPSATDLPFFPEDGPRSRTTSLSQPDSGQFTEDDPFTASLNISDIDRRHDAWIPSEVTRQVLVSIMTSPPGTYLPAPDQLTMPGLVSEEPLGDPVRDLVQRYMGDQEAQKRACLGQDNVAQDETGLRQLIKAECWRSAVDLTGRLLTQCGQGLGKVGSPTKHTPYTLQLWFCRLSLQTRLHMYSVVDGEMQAFGNLDKPDLFYEFYQDKYPGRRGSMVPFGLRVLHAELPQHLGKTQESLDRLYYLVAIVTKILSNLESGLAEDGSMISLSDDSRRVSRELWEGREIQLLYSVSNCMLSIKDYSAALRVLEDLLKKDVTNKDKLLCAVARIYLQVGDITTAQKYFTSVEKTSPEYAKSCQNHMNKGFLALGQNRFIEAYQDFEAAVAADPNNAVAVNNMAVCALYTGQLTSALDTLENLVQTSPEIYLQEGILFNLCTLYELESSHAIYRKQQLLAMVTKYKGNGFNAACLKM